MDGHGPEADRVYRDALETLRGRYARDELSEGQFERVLERFEPETPEAARASVEHERAADRLSGRPSPEPTPA